MEKEERDLLIHNMTCGVSTSDGSISYASTDKEINEALLLENDKIYNCDKEEEEEEGDDDEMDEDNYLKEYRQKRLAELKSIRIKRYGTLELVTPIKLLEIIDDKENDIFVIVHLIDRYTTDSVYCHNLLLVGCPLINVYKKGELYKCFVKITEKLGHDYTVDDLEK